MTQKRIKAYIAAVRNLFNLENPDARIVLAELIKKANVFKPTFDPANPYNTAFQEGQRHIVCSILDKLHKDYTKLAEQLKQLENETES